MDRRPVLVIMAGGMGGRYGRLKQLDPAVVQAIGKKTDSGLYLERLWEEET